MDFTAGDKLCLDGERLISLDNVGTPQRGAALQDAAELASGQYREFRTEKDSYARIRAYGVADSAYPGSGPAYFKVWTKSGLIHEYGASPSADANTQALILNSAPAAQPRRFAQVWAIARTTDSFGNVIDFKYSQRNVNWGTSATYQTGREWNLAEIQYAGNKVGFGYVDRTGASPQDASEAYHLGSKNVSLRRLSSITTYINSPNTAALGPSASAVAVKTYKLGFDNGPVTKRSRLTRVQECAGSASSTRCLPASIFTYTAGGDEAYQASTKFNLGGVVLANNPAGYPYNTLAYGTYGTVGADFNGDGLTDLLRWADNPAENVLYLSNGDGSFTAAPAFNLAGTRLFSNDACFASIVRDINGDGISDILRYAAPNGVQSIVGNGFCSNNEPSRIFIGNGDGSFTPYALNGVTLKLQNNGLGANSGTYSWSGGSVFYLVDYDGDGLVDIVTSTIPSGSGPMNGPFYGCNASIICTRVFRNTGAPGVFAEIATASAHMNLFQNAKGMPLGGRLVDLDADGLLDLSINVSANSLFFADATYVALSNGDGTFRTANGVSCESGTSMTNVAIDYNGDGRKDCLFAPDGALYPHFGVFDLAGAPAATVANGNLPQVSDRTNSTIVADVNEDGRDDVIGFPSASAYNSLYLSNGDGTVSKSTSFNLANVLLKSPNAPNMAFVQGDFRGMGNFEFVRIYNTYGTLNASNTLYVKANSERPDLLRSVTTPTGASYVITHVPLTSSEVLAGGNGKRYLTDRGTTKSAVRPFVDIIAPTYVVASLASDSGVGGQATVTEFKYVGMKADSLLGVAQGFREVWQQSLGFDGSLLTTVTEYGMERPYIGMPTRISVYKGGLLAAAPVNRISQKVNVYCDQLASTSAVTAAIASGLPCASPGILKRPYLLWSQDSSTDLDGSVLPLLTTQTAVNATGDPISIVATTSGTLAGLGQVFLRTTTNTYQSPDDTSCSSITTCNWILGRLVRTTVASSAPNTLDSLAASAGTLPTASSTQGSGALRVMNPAVLSVILELLLD